MPENSVKPIPITRKQIAEIIDADGAGIRLPSVYIGSVCEENLGSITIGDRGGLIFEPYSLELSKRYLRKGQTIQILDEDGYKKHILVD